MPANTFKIYPLTVQTAAVQFTNADNAMTSKTLFTSGTNATRIDSIAATSTETVNDVVFNLLIVDASANAYQVGTVKVPKNSGTDAANAYPAKAVLNENDLPWLDDSGSIFLKAGWSLKLQNKTQVASGKQINFVAFCGDY